MAKTIEHLLEALQEPPMIELHACGVMVARDDRLPGGTKARYLIRLFDTYDEIVYASSPFGGAQLALAYCALLLGKQATIFAPRRARMHPRTAEARDAGARVIEVENANLGKLQTQATKYCRQTGAKYVEFGGESPEAIRIIGSIASQVWKTHGPFDEVWSAAGSGVLTRGLQAGMPAERFVAVQIGRHVNARATRR